MRDSTVTCADALFPSTVAVIAAEPGLTALTFVSQIAEPHDAHPAALHGATVTVATVGGGGGGGGADGSVVSPPQPPNSTACPARIASDKNPSRACLIPSLPALVR